MLGSDGKPVNIVSCDEEIESIAVHGRNVILGIKERPCKAFPLTQVTMNRSLDTAQERDVFPGVVGATFMAFDPTTTR